jgi:hypothetical protein
MKQKIIIGLVSITVIVIAIFFLFPQYFSNNKVRILITHYDYRRGYLELAGIAENIGKEPIKYNPPLNIRVFDDDKKTITESTISLMSIQTDNSDVTPATFGEFDCLIKIPSGYGHVNWELTIDKVPYQVDQKNKPLTE